MKISISYINQGFQKYPSSQLSPALVEQFASFAWTFLASSRLALSPSQPVPFPVASFIASSASAKVEAALLFLFFISFPQLSTLLASLNSTWALLNFFVFATRSAKQVSCLPLARSPPCLLIDFCFLTFFSLFFGLSFFAVFFSLLCLCFFSFPDFFLPPFFALFLLFFLFCFLLHFLSPFSHLLPASLASLSRTRFVSALSTSSRSARENWKRQRQRRARTIFIIVV